MLATRAASNAAQFDLAIAHGERSIELATSLGNHPERRLAIARLGDILLEGHQQRSIELLTKAIEEPGLNPDTPGYLNSRRFSPRRRCEAFTMYEQSS